jgi:hypothetical protein
MSVQQTNRFWSVSLEHTLFLDFLKLFVNMCLALSFVGKQKSYFLDLRIKSYGCLKFQGEVWAGRACAGANQQELTTCTKSGGQEEKIFQEKLGTAPQVQVSTRDRQATAGRHLRLWDSSNFFEIFILKKRTFGSLGDGPGLLREWVYSTPIF